MRWIDRYAYGNRIRKLDPAYKAGFSLGVMLICLVLDRPLVSLAALGCVTLLAIFWAGLPPRFVLQLLFVESSFLVVGVMGVVISLSAAPALHGLHVGPVWISATPASLALGEKLLARSLGCAGAMNFLALTTPLVDLIELLRRLRTPELLIDLMTLIYRFVFTLLDSLEHMILAQEVRLGFSGLRACLRSAGQIGANLFIEAFRRSQRLQTALEGRGWDDTLRVLPQEYERPAWPWRLR